MNLHLARRLNGCLLTFVDSPPTPPSTHRELHPEKSVLLV